MDYSHICRYDAGHNAFFSTSSGESVHSTTFAPHFDFFKKVAEQVVAKESFSRAGLEFFRFLFARCLDFGTS